MREWTIDQLVEFRNSKRELLRTLDGYNGSEFRDSPPAIILKFLEAPVAAEVDEVIRREFAGVPVEIVQTRRVQAQPSRVDPN